MSPLLAQIHKNPCKYAWLHPASNWTKPVDYQLLQVYGDEWEEFAQNRGLWRARRDMYAIGVAEAFEANGNDGCEFSLRDWLSAQRDRLKQERTKGAPCLLGGWLGVVAWQPVYRDAISLARE